MSSYTTLLKPRWMAGHLFALALVVLFVSLGFWQLRRGGERERYNALLTARLEAPPSPFETLTSRYSLAAPAEEGDAVAYRRVALSGRFDPEHEVLLRSRALDGQPGYHVLTPLVLEGDRALLVDRGWVPYALNTPPVAEAAPPEGTVEVTGILFPRQIPTGGLSPRDPAEGRLETVAWVDTERLEKQTPYTLEPLYLELTTQTPAQTGALPVPPPPPDLEPGPHLSYALQWFSFALIGVIGYASLMRQIVREAAAPGRKRKRVKAS